jgi:recombination protein RecT
MTQALTIKEYMSAPAVREKMQEMLQSPDIIRQFTTSVISIAGSDELLATAEPRSLFNACLTAASLNLPINKNLGFAHIIGYKNNKKGVTEAQFQLGARGFKELAQRTGQYSIINQGDVREGELSGRNRLTGQIEFKWVEDDVIRMDLPIIGYFSFFRLKNGFESILYMSVDELNAHGKRYSQSFKRGYGPWTDNHEAMCLKTVSKLNISKNGPLSVELQKAIGADQAVIKDDVNASEEKKQAIIEAGIEQASKNAIAKKAKEEADDDITNESIEQGLDQAIEEAQEQEQGQLIGEVAKGGNKTTRNRSRNA